MICLNIHSQSYDQHNNNDIYYTGHILHLKLLNKNLS